MSRMKLGRILMTLVLLLQAISGLVLDWTSNHILNPLWHPHARFHGALLLFLLSGVSATAVWLMWRESKEPEVSITVAAFISLSFWTPFFYITFLLPSSSLWAGDPNAVPHFAGHVFYPNVAVAGVFLLATATAWLLCRSDRAVYAASN